jgi:hypothetical protein
MLSPHETFTKATHLILFLRTEDWLSRFYAARVKSGKARSEDIPFGYPKERTSLMRSGTSDLCQGGAVHSIKSGLMHALENKYGRRVSRVSAP